MITFFVAGGLALARRKAAIGTRNGINPLIQETEMKGFIKLTAAGCLFSAALFTLIGCTAYRDAVDPCWPRLASLAALGRSRRAGR